MASIRDFLGTSRLGWLIGKATLDASGLTAARTLALPDAAGTVALTGHGHVIGDVTSLQAALDAKYPVPTGAVLPYAGAVEPPGWLLCAGQNLSRAAYPALFGVLGTTYGAGNGSTTFGLPDLRGRVPAGKDDMGGSAANRVTSAVSGVAGATLGAAGGDQCLHAHAHNMYILTQSSGLVNQGAGATALNWGWSGTSAQGAGASQNVPPCIILNYIIRT